MTRCDYCQGEVINHICTRCGMYKLMPTVDSIFEGNLSMRDTQNAIDHYRQGMFKGDNGVEHNKPEIRDYNSQAEAKVERTSVPKQVPVFTIVAPVIDSSRSWELNKYQVRDKNGDIAVMSAFDINQARHNGAMFRPLRCKILAKNKNNFKEIIYTVAFDGIADVLYLRSRDLMIAIQCGRLVAVSATVYVRKDANNRKMLVLRGRNERAIYIGQVRRRLAHFDTKEYNNQSEKEYSNRSDEKSLDALINIITELGND